MNIPCKCGLPADRGRHIECVPSGLLSTLDLKWWHAYEPDESSVEYAALKLREALETAAIYVSYLALDAPDVSVESADRLGELAEKCKKALELADRAGIKTTATNEER